MLIRKISTYGASVEDKQAQGQDFINLISGLGFTCQIELDERGNWPDKAIINNVPVPVSNYSDKLTVSNLRYRSRHDGSITINIKHGELIANPRRFKNRLTEIFEKCQAQHAADLERMQNRQDIELRAKSTNTWIKANLNTYCSAHPDRECITIEIKTFHGEYVFSISYNCKTTEYTVQQQDVASSRYTWYNQTSLQELKNRVEKLEDAMTQAQSIITQMQFNKII